LGRPSNQLKGARAATRSSQSSESELEDSGGFGRAFGRALEGAFGCVAFDLLRGMFAHRRDLRVQMSARRVDT